MKYLATAFAISFMVFGFAATPAQANGQTCLSGAEWDPDAGPNGACVSERYGEITDVEPLEQHACTGGHCIEGKPGKGGIFKEEDNDGISVASGVPAECQGEKRLTRRCRFILDTFADREDGRDGDVGGGDFGGDADRAAASTSAE